MQAWIFPLWVALVGCSRSSHVGGSGHLHASINESSGLVRSQVHDGIYWTHNDSGDRARLFAVRADGSLVRDVAVDGAQNVDWEDIAADGQGHLWIADTGNNLNMRRDLTLYRVPEPDPRAAGDVRADRTVRVRYPDQQGFPDPMALNFDAEALFWAGDTLWLLSKRRSDHHTVLYRVPALDGDVLLERVSELDLKEDPANYGGLVSGADVDPTGERLAVLTYHAVYLFGRPEDGRAWLSRPLSRVEFSPGALGQCEGVAWEGQALLLTNEAGEIYRIADPLRAASFPGSSG